MSHDGEPPPKRQSNVVGFPQSRVSPTGAQRPIRFLGLGRMAQAIGAPEEQATGHWCSRCQGIWFGYLLEVACPLCGNRHG